jgi:hypothetical protein
LPADIINTGEILFEDGKKWKDGRSLLIRVKLFQREKMPKHVPCEPPDWIIPAGNISGAYLLQMNNAEKQEKDIPVEDLVWNPGNGWSLLGCIKVL